MSKKNKKETVGSAKDNKFPLPIYKKEDDIYSQGKNEPIEDEDNIGKRGPDNENRGPDDDLDVPGAELDDTDEALGEEDEENNYYSLGGDDNYGLEKDKA